MKLRTKRIGDRELNAIQKNGDESLKNKTGSIRKKKNYIMREWVFRYLWMGLNVI